MAGETALPPQEFIIEQDPHQHVERKENEELKAIEHEIVSPSKENVETDGEQKPKAEEPANPKAPATESEEKIEDRKTHQPAVMEVEKAENVNESPRLNVPSEVDAKVTEDTDPKPGVFSISEPAVKYVENEPEHSKIADALESAVEAVTKPLELPPTQEPGPEVRTKPEEVSEPESKIVMKPESVVDEPEVGNDPEIVQSEPKNIRNSDSFVEAPTVGKELEVSESESKVVEKPVPVVEVEDKPKEQAENVEEVEKTSEKLEPEESMEEKLAKDEGVLVNKVKEATESLTEEEIRKNQEIVACKSSDAFVSTNLETPSDLKDGEVSIAADVSEKAHVDGTQREESGVYVVEESPKEPFIGVRKLDEEKNVNDEESTESESTKTEEGGDINSATEITEKSFEGQKASVNVEVVTEGKKEENFKDDIASTVDTEPPTTKTEEGGDSTSATEVTEKSFEEQKAPRDVARVTEEKKEENVKDDIKAAVETTKDTDPQKARTEEAVDSTSATEVTEKPFEEKHVSRDVEMVIEEKEEENVKDVTTTSAETIKDHPEGKVGVVNTVDTAKKLVGEPEKLELEAKAKDTEGTDVDKLTKSAEVVEETSKSDSSILESSKAVTVSKKIEDPSKVEVPAKPVQKQSNNIISKVKQSIVKVKKAIIGKSPSSKTITSEAKGDITVK